MDDFAPMVLVTVGLAFACIGVAATCADYRHFDSIKSQCETQGYIQDKTTRISCAVEKK